MKKIIVLLLGIHFFVIETRAQSVIDIDGNTYNTITLGTQIWMKENLKTTHFNNGDLIGTTALAIISNDSTSVYQWSYNDDTLNINTYGRLYTWHVVNDSRNVCPAGWHVPSDIEMTNLANFLGGDTIAGNKMKEAGTIHWATTNVSVTNSSSFTGLPGGFRGNPYGFININTLGNFWTSTPWGINTFPRAYTYQLKSTSSALVQSIAVANCGLSIRCLKDITSNIENIALEDKILIFPNPTKNILNISFDEIGNYNTSIYDIKGVLMLEKKMTGGINTFDLNALPKGMYIIKIESRSSTLERKIIVE